MAETEPRKDENPLESAEGAPSLEDLENILEVKRDDSKKSIKNAYKKKVALIYQNENLSEKERQVEIIKLERARNVLLGKEKIGGERQEDAEQKLINFFTRGEEAAPEPKKRLEVRLKTVAHEGHPETNEDATVIDQENGIFGVFDGMGGPPAGDVASNLAKDRISGKLKKLPRDSSPEEISQALKTALLQVSEEILVEANAAPQKYQNQYGSMGTTASVVKMWEGKGGEKKAIIGNVGDSRVYIFRSGKLEQITLDDNLVSLENSDEDARKIQEEFNNVVNYTDIDPQTSKRRWFKKRNQLSQNLGEQDNINPRMYTVELKEGEKIIIMSDGVSDNLTDKEMEVILTQGTGNDVENLVSASLKRSNEDHLRAKEDDMSAVVIEFPKSEVVRQTPAKIEPEDKKEDGEKPEPVSAGFEKLKPEQISYWADLLSKHGYRLEKLSPGKLRGALGHVYEIYQKKDKGNFLDRQEKGEIPAKIRYSVKREGGSLVGSDQEAFNEIRGLKEFLDTVEDKQVAGVLGTLFGIEKSQPKEPEKEKPKISNKPKLETSGPINVPEGASEDERKKMDEQLAAARKKIQEAEEKRNKDRVVNKGVAAVSPQVAPAAAGTLDPVKMRQNQNKANEQKLREDIAERRGDIAEGQQENDELEKELKAKKGRPDKTEDKEASEKMVKGMSEAAMPVVERSGLNEPTPDNERLREEEEQKREANEALKKIFSESGKASEPKDERLERTPREADAAFYLKKLRSKEEAAKYERLQRMLKSAEARPEKGKFSEKSIRGYEKQIEKLERKARWAEEDYLGSEKYYQDQKEELGTRIEEVTEEISQSENPREKDRKKLDRMLGRMDRLEEKVNPPWYKKAANFALKWSGVGAASRGLKWCARRAPITTSMLTLGLGLPYAIKELNARHERGESEMPGWAEKVDGAYKKFSGDTGKTYELPEKKAKKTKAPEKKPEEETGAIDWSDFKKGWQGILINLKKLELVGKDGEVALGQIEAIDKAITGDSAREALVIKLLTDPKCKDLQWAISLADKLGGLPEKLKEAMGQIKEMTGIEINAEEAGKLTVEAGPYGLEILVKTGSRTLFEKLANSKSKESPELEMNAMVISRKITRGKHRFIVYDLGHAAIKKGEEGEGGYEKYKLENLRKHERQHMEFENQYGAEGKKIKKGSLEYVLFRAQSEILASVLNHPETSSFAYKFDSSRKSFGTYNYGEGLSEEDKNNYKSTIKNALLELDNLVAAIGGNDARALAVAELTKEKELIALDKWPNKIKEILGTGEFKNKYGQDGEKRATEENERRTLDTKVKKVKLRELISITEQVLEYLKNNPNMDLKLKKQNGLKRSEWYGQRKEIYEDQVSGPSISIDQIVREKATLDKNFQGYKDLAKKRKK